MTFSETLGPDEAILDKDIQHLCASEVFSLSPYMVFGRFPCLQCFESASGALQVGCSEAVHAFGLQFSASEYMTVSGSVYAGTWTLSESQQTKSAFLCGKIGGCETKA